ncbi:MAG: guanylate kinase [bacterium]
MSRKKKNLLVISSPSGGGKSTVARYLLGKYSNLKFSVSATTRPKRPNEIEAKDYYFLSKDVFIKKIESGELVEYEKIFGNYYGTLKSEINNAKKLGLCLLFDIDVKGALSIQKIYPNDALLIFLSPPDMKTLEKRLRKRSTETSEQINIRLSRTNMEMDLREQFDYDIINNNLEDTLKSVEKIVLKYINVYI